MGAGAQRFARQLPPEIEEMALQELCAGDERFSSARFQQLKDPETGLCSREAILSELAIKKPAPLTPEEQSKLEEDVRILCGKQGKKHVNSTALAALLEGGQANPCSCDEDGWSALHYAAGEGHITAAEVLIRAGGDELLNLASEDDGCTSLWVASFNNQRNMAVLLMNRGADLEPKGRDDSAQPRVPPCTAAGAARRNNNPGLADLLLSETRLRVKDPARQAKLKAGHISAEDFRISLKAEEALANSEDLEKTGEEEAP